MVTGVVVPQDDNLPLELHGFDGLADYQQAVGGSIEAVDLDSPALTLFVNDEGKIHGMPVNRRATLLVWLTNCYLRRRDVICGPAVLVGPPDEFGNSQGVPTDFLALLFEAGTYAVEVQTVDYSDAWVGNLNTFDDYWQAATYALTLAERWLGGDAHQSRRGALIPGAPHGSGSPNAAAAHRRDRLVVTGGLPPFFMSPIDCYYGCRRCGGDSGPQR